VTVTDCEQGEDSEQRALILGWRVRGIIIAVEGERGWAVGGEAGAALDVLAKPPRR
jgi:hypothetical protein